MQELLPVIALDRWDDPAARPAIAASVDDALRSVGFLQISGHGIAPSIIEGALAALDVFVGLPFAAKCAYRPPSAAVNRGYAPLGSESLSYSLGKEAPLWGCLLVATREARERLRQGLWDGATSSA